VSLPLIINSFVGDAAFAGFDEALPLIKEFEWLTDVVQYGAWSEQRNQISTRPRRHWFINWSYMDKAARDKLIELAHAGRGRWETFLLTDSDEFQATTITINTDGTLLNYQLKDTYYSGETYTWDEDKKDIVPGGTFAPVVTHNIDGAQTEVAAAPGANEYTLDDTTGIMSWSAGNAPSAGVLTCTFQYYFRVRFTSDAHRDTMFETDLYRNPSIHVVEVVP
jgi:uncharacterized protein (TIGR02217 family)